MAHQRQIDFVKNIKKFLPRFFDNQMVLEVGSLDINGTVRDFFESCKYTGIDLGEGNGVDVVTAGEDFGGRAHQFDTIISCEAMEHNSNWRETWINMIRMLKKDGIMIMTCASEGRPRHGTHDSDQYSSPFTSQEGMNYYRNLVPKDFTEIINHDQWFSVWGFFQDHVVRDLYFFGVGLEADPNTRSIANQLKVAFDELYYKINIEGR